MRANEGEGRGKGRQAAGEIWSISQRLRRQNWTATAAPAAPGSVVGRLLEGPFVRHSTTPSSHSLYLESLSRWSPAEAAAAVRCRTRGCDVQWNVALFPLLGSSLTDSPPPSPHLQLTRPPHSIHLATVTPISDLHRARGHLIIALVVRGRLRRLKVPRERADPPFPAHFAYRASAQLLRSFDRGCGHGRGWRSTP